MLSLFVLIPCSAEANSAEEFEYDFIGDGTVYITKYKGNSKEVVIPSTVEGYTVSRIGSNVFSQSNNIYSVVVPDSVDTLERSAFYNLKNLKNVTLGSGIKTIKEEAFNYCENLQNINLPDTIVSVAGGAFANTKWLLNQPDGLIYVGKVAYKYKGECPQSITIQSGTTEIADEAFLDCSLLTQVIIPHGVKAIGRQAFYNCTALSSISIPDTVCDVGTDAFYNTDWYNEKADGLIYSGKVAYKYKGECPKKITLNVGTTGIAGSAFRGCSALESVLIPFGVEVLGDYCFCECKALKTIDLPETIYDIGECAFELCYVIDNIRIPKKITVIKQSTFHMCYRLSDITLPANITRIEQAAFFVCENIKSFEIPNNVKYIGTHAFSGCRGLEKISIPDSVTYLGMSAFSQCSNLTRVRLSNNLKTVTGFTECKKLKNIYIPNGVTSIGYQAFRYCYELSSITIPKSVTVISDRTFTGCSKLSDVYYEGSEEEWNEIAIGSIENYNLEHATIHYNSFYNDAELSVLDERFDHDLQWYAKNWDSTQYNPELAHLMMTMSNAAYNQSNVKKAYEELGLSNYNSSFYDEHFADYGTEKAPFSTGYVKDDDGAICVLVTIKGSGDFKDITQGFLDWMGNISLKHIEQDGLIVNENFYNTMRNVLKELEKYMYDCFQQHIENMSDVKYFITGHSRGAAVGNLLEIELEKIVGKQRVYGYNYAVPDYVKAKRTHDLSNGYENIFNLSHIQDEVSYLPGFLIDPQWSFYEEWINNEEDSYCKLGNSVWFDDGQLDEIGIDAHVDGQKYYINYLRNRYPISNYTDNPKIHLDYWKSMFSFGYEYKYYATFCPVDVELIDENGKVIASVTNDVADYHGSHFGDVIITTDEDHKLIAVPSDSNYTLRIVGNDNGTMDYFVKKVDLTNDKVNSTNSYKDVTLESGKLMLGKTVNILDEETKTITWEEKLLLMDGQGNTDTEILANGEETDYNVKYILGDADNNGSIDIIDATFIQRKLADIATPYTDEILHQGDADGSGELDVIDVTMIQRYLVDIKTPYLIGTDVV